MLHLQQRFGEAEAGEAVTPDLQPGQGGGDGVGGGWREVHQQGQAGHGHTPQGSEHRAGHTLLLQVNLSQLCETSRAKKGEASYLENVVDVETRETSEAGGLDGGGELEAEVPPAVVDQEAPLGHQAGGGHTQPLLALLIVY